MDTSQFGFRNGQSTIQAITVIVAAIVASFEEGQHVNLILCDATKTFDCVAHDLLIKKLDRYDVLKMLKLSWKKTDVTMH